jgi:hypothetical protein
MRIFRLMGKCQEKRENYIIKRKILAFSKYYLGGEFDYLKGFPTYSTNIGDCLGTATAAETNSITHFHVVVF